MTTDLPPGWANPEIGEILQPLEDGRTIHQGWSPRCEKDPSSSDAEWGVLKTTAIQAGVFLPQHNKRLPATLEPRPHLEVKSGDLLLTSAGPRSRCGVACIVNNTRPRLMISGKMYRFRFDEDSVLPKYIEAYLQSHRAWVDIDKMKTGVSDSGLNLTQDRFRRLKIPVAPVTEQRRIVVAIEEHFSRLDAATSTASAAALKATASRRSVLLGAFSGKLSTQNCDDEPALMLLDRIAESRSQSKSQLSTTALRIDDDVSAPQRELPPGWAWARLQDLSAAEPRAITDGPFGSNLKTAHYTETGPRVIRLQNIGDGEFRREDAHISLDHYESLLAHSVQQDDLIVASLGESLPRACLVPDWVPPAIVKADCIRVRLHPEVNRSYVNLTLQDPRLRKETNVDIKGVGRPRLGLQRIRQLAVPLAPRAEQDRIVEAVEEHFSRLTAVSSAVSAATLKIQALRRAVLARAFTGQLVPQ